MPSILCFDYGERRIGIAVGHLEIGLANPLQTLTVPDSGLPWEQIEKVVKQWSPLALVVGYVAHPTQNNNQLKSSILDFCKQLKSRYHLPVEMMEESYSSTRAYEILKEMRSKGQRKKIQKSDIDKAAAAIILDGWMANNTDYSPAHNNE